MELPKPINSFTIEEAEAYRRGYQDGLRAQVVHAARGAKEKDHYDLLDCQSSYPDRLCKCCNCWKSLKGPSNASDN